MLLVYWSVRAWWKKTAKKSHSSKPTLPARQHSLSKKGNSSSIFSVSGAVLVLGRAIGWWGRLLGSDDKLDWQVGKGAERGGEFDPNCGGSMMRMRLLNWVIRKYKYIWYIRKTRIIYIYIYSVRFNMAIARSPVSKIRSATFLVEVTGATSKTFAKIHCDLSTHNSGS